MSLKLPVLIIVAVLALPESRVNAANLYNSRATWQAAVTGEMEVDLASQVGDGDTLVAGSSINLPFGQTISFDKDLEGRQVTDSWATWSGGNTPRVLYLNEVNFDGTQVVGSFSSAVGAFGLEMQPNNLFELTMTLLLSDGSSLAQVVDGDGGAAFFGWVDNGGPGIIGVTLSSEDFDGFAFGRMIQGNVQAPDGGTSLTILALGLAALGTVRCCLAKKIN